MARIVQKFSAASARNPERIGRCVARRVASCCAQGDRMAVLAALIGTATGCRSALARTVVRRRIGAFDQRLTGSRELAMIAPS